MLYEVITGSAFGHADVDVKDLAAIAGKHATGGRHIGVIAAHGHADVAIPGDQVISRVKTDPTQSR